MERLRAESREQAAALDRARLAAVAQHQQSQLQQPAPPPTQRPVKTPRPRNGQLRGAFAGAVAASFLFIVGMVLANFHAVTPITGRLTNGSVEEQVPFGATTLHPAPAPTRPVTAARPALIPAASPAVAKPQPTRSSAPPTQQKQQWHRFQRTSSNQDDATADDVVVRHFGPPRKPPTQTAQQRAGLKHYSDE
jgi:hypothetical protein